MQGQDPAPPRGTHQPRLRPTGGHPWATLCSPPYGSHPAFSEYLGPLKLVQLSGLPVLPKVLSAYVTPNVLCFLSDRTVIKFLSGKLHQLTTVLFYKISFSEFCVLSDFFTKCSHPYFQLSELVNMNL